MGGLKEDRPLARWVMTITQHCFEAEPFRLNSCVLHACLSYVVASRRLLAENWRAFTLT